jgi:hypothetical protein
VSEVSRRRSGGEASQLESIIRDVMASPAMQDSVCRLIEQAHDKSMDSNAARACLGRCEKAVADPFIWWIVEEQLRGSPPVLVQEALAGTVGSLLVAVMACTSDNDPPDMVADQIAKQFGDIIRLELKRVRLAVREAVREAACE